MKLRQNARELVLMEIEGLGLILGEIRYNKQTETAIFALEKAAFFDLYLPCAVVFDQKKGVIVQPHLLSILTQGSIRIQRSKVSCFVLGDDIAPTLRQQFQAIVSSLGRTSGDGLIEQKDDKGKDPNKPTGQRPKVITLKREKEE